MKLRTKLLLAEAPMAAALLVLAALALRAALALGRAPGAILHDNFRSFDAASAMLVELAGLDGHAARGLAAATSTAASVERFERELRLQESNLTEDGEAEATRALRAAWETYRGALAALGPVGRPAAEPRAGPGAGAGAGPGPAADEAVRARSLEVRRAVSAILTLNRDAIRRRSRAARDQAAEAGALLGLAALGTLLVGFTVSALWLRRLLAPLRVLGRGVRRLAAGDFDGRIRLRGDDELAALAGAFNDMAARLAAYRASTLGELLVANNRLEAVMASLGDAVVVFDLAGQPVLRNLAAEALFGRGADLRLDALPEGLREVARDAFEHVRARAEPVDAGALDRAVEVAGRDGPRWVVVAATPVRGSEGRLDGVTLAFRDVTRARRIEGFRGDLVAAAAHELRTPLTSLHLAVHLCLEEAAGPLTERQKDLLDAARRDCERLQGEVEALLEMARLEAGQVKLERVRVLAGDLCRDAVERHEAAARQRGCELRARPGDALLAVSADPERIRHALDNLIDNALRYAAGGAVEVGFAAEPAPPGAAGPGRAEDPAQVRFVVDDAGPGVPAELRERVFDKFFRVPGSLRGGAGLGLTIVRDIVRAHGGEVGVEGAPLGGSRFWFTLPCRAEGAAPA